MTYTVWVGRTLRGRYGSLGLARANADSEAHPGAKAWRKLSGRVVVRDARGHIVYSKNPRRRVSRKARSFLGRKIRALAHEGMRAPRRIAAAYSLARRKGYKVPRKNPRGKSESQAWREVKMVAQGIRRATTSQAIYNNADGLVDLADRMLSQVARGIHENPTLAILGNPPAKVVGTLSRRLYELRYKHASDGKDYRHPFGPGASVLLLADGSVLVRAKHRLWEDV